MAGSSVLPAQDGTVQALLDFALERGYLYRLETLGAFPLPSTLHRPVRWVRMQCLPISPLDQGNELSARWARALGALHSIEQRLHVLLHRRGAVTRLLLGGSRAGTGAPTEQLVTLMTGHLPGMHLQPLGADEAATLDEQLLGYSVVGAVTGLPATSGGPGTAGSTLDQLAQGLRTIEGGELDYSVLVVADPVPDPDIAAAIHAARTLGSELHAEVRRTVTTSRAQQTGRSRGRGLAMLTQLLGAVVGIDPDLTSVGAELSLAGNVLGATGGGRTSGTNEGVSGSTEYLDKAAQYCERAADMHVARLQLGRSTGMWRVGVYVLAASTTTVGSVLGVIRAGLSGDESFLEPIRTHHLRTDPVAAGWIRRAELLPLPERLHAVAAAHPLGPLFDGLATPWNSRELTIATLPPRRDVSGLRVVRNAVPFGGNAPEPLPGRPAVDIGQLVSDGAATGVRYRLALDTLVRHSLVTGVTGSGKSTTCLRIVEAVMEAGIPCLIIEPAKTEYVAWALAANRTRDAGIAVVGAGTPPRGINWEQLRLNLFEAAQLGDTVDLAGRCERVSAMLAASLPTGDIFPLLLDEILVEVLRNHVDVGFLDGPVARPARYPTIAQIRPVARSVIAARGYEPRVTDNLLAMAETRLAALSRGRRGAVFETAASTSFATLFDGPCVVNLSGLPDQRDRALIMGLLLAGLEERRRSGAAPDGTRLTHLLVVEEAHRLLGRLSGPVVAGDPQAAVATAFAELIAEVRAYGQGVAIVDQTPARLLPDVVKGTNMKIVHRLVAVDDRAAMASAMSLSPAQEAVIARLRTGEAIVCGDSDDTACCVAVEAR